MSGGVMVVNRYALRFGAGALAVANGAQAAGLIDRVRYRGPEGAGFRRDKW